MRGKGIFALCWPSRRRNRPALPTYFDYAVSRNHPILLANSEVPKKGKKAGEAYARKSGPGTLK
jgi:hypothetical protein